MKPTPTALAAALLLLATGSGSPTLARGGGGAAASAPQFIRLDGVREHVSWNDGDSFAIKAGPRQGQKARLAGYNTLESYGPVHFWSAFHGEELYWLAKEATHVVRSEEWVCRSLGVADGYGRIIVSCPDAAKRLVGDGLAHVFAVDQPADGELLALQMEAQRARRGIWAKGIPSHIVTSVHSTEEGAGRGGGDEQAEPRAYNRICDTATGESVTVEHHTAFKACDVWCHGGSCLLYLPFDVRYGRDKPLCVKRGKRNRLVVPPHLRYPMKRSGR